jgi:hypothetical protein
MKNLDAKNNDLHYFFRFLKEKGVYKTYFREVKKNNSSWSTLNATYKGNLSKCLKAYAFSTTSLIDRTLDWRKTELGLDGWENLSNEYQCFLDKHKKDEKGIKK